MIYFVEGIPGGGKSSYSRKLYEESNGNAIYFKEEYKNPIDLLRQAVLSKEEYNRFCADIYNVCKNFADADEVYVQIKSSVTYLGEKVFLPYMHINTKNKTLKKALLSLYDKEVDDGKTKYDEYCNLIIKRLSYFIKCHKAESDYIFDGALFHNPLISILGFYKLPVERILCFYREIHSILKHSEYTVYLIHVNDIGSVIEKTAKNRYSLKGFVWQQGFEQWFSQTLNYKNNRGIKGIIDFAKEISDYEELVIREIPFNTKIIERG